MITLKTFNNLPPSKRRQVARIVFSHMGDKFVEQMATPFHHNFDYEDGHWYKLMLSHCSYNKEKNHVTVTIHIPV